MILTILTTAGYGEQAVTQAPEKSWVEKITEAIFADKAVKKGPENTSTNKTVKKVTEEEPAKALTPKTSEKVAEKKPANTSNSEATEKIADKTPEKTVPKKIVEKVVVKNLPEISMGSKDAPVVMINYSSLSCGHCAHFHTDILPQIEEKYIKPGYLRIVFRDYPGDQVSLRAHQLAWCKGEIKYLDFMKLLYTNQEKWLLAPDPVVALKAIALQNGIPAKQFEACLKNQELLDQIVSIRLEGQKKYNITATPTIVINAKIYQKALTLEEITDIMKPLLASSLEKGKKG
jgi:protein-disulfide isomerase